MVADDEIHAFRFRIDNLFRGFDAAVQGDDEPHALAGCEVDAFDRDTVTFGITVGDVEHQVFVPDLAQELVNQRDGRAAVHVVVAVNHDLLIVRNGPFDPLDRPVHVLHQKRIVQVGEARLKELLRLFYIVYASLYEQVGQHGRDPQSGSQHGYRRGVALRLYYPAFFYRHTNYYLYILTLLSNYRYYVFISFRHSPPLLSLPSAAFANVDRLKAGFWRRCPVARLRSPPQFCSAMPRPVS